MQDSMARVGGQWATCLCLFVLLNDFSHIILTVAQMGNLIPFPLFKHLPLLPTCEASPWNFLQAVCGPWQYHDLVQLTEEFLQPSKEAGTRPVLK